MSTQTAEQHFSTKLDTMSPTEPRGAYEAYRLLHVAFIAAPIIAGLDKFTHLLADWDRYLAPALAEILPVAPSIFMRTVGVIEILAGILVALRPAAGGYLVAVWLWGIVLNLLLGAGYYDIALRDLGLSLGALALARLSVLFPPSSHPR